MPDDFEVESLYTPDQWYVDDVLEVTKERVRAITDTSKMGAVVAAQKPWPGQPKHVPGILMIQITGTLGNIHAVYGLGLKMTEGWVGFGTHIHEASFRNLGEIGPPIELELVADKVKSVRGQTFGRYSFRFEQAGKLLYTSKQTAVWTRNVPSQHSASQ